MLETIQLVRGAVSDKDLIPVLTHFHLYEGRIQGGNGRVTIDSSIDLEHDSPLTVPAEKFLAAIDATQAEEVEIENTCIHLEGNRLQVTLPLANSATYPRMVAPKKYTKLKEPMLEILRRLKPFINTDAARVNLCGVAVRDGYAYGVSNVTLARMRTCLPNFILPVYLIDELLRIGIEPTGWHTAEGKITFRLTKDAWIQSTTFSEPWPDVEAIFDSAAPKRYSRIDAAALQEAISKVLPFCPDDKFPALRFGEEGVSTQRAEMHAVASIKVPQGSWHAKNISLVLTEATHFNLKQWPKPCAWKGDGIEGVTVGLSS